jgi:hypothetical protein
MVNKVARGDNAQYEAGMIKGMEKLLNEIEYIHKKTKLNN